MPIPQIAAGLLDSVKGMVNGQNIKQGVMDGYHNLLQTLGIPLGEPPAPVDNSADQLSQQMNQNAVNRAAASHVDPRTQVPRIRR